MNSDIYFMIFGVPCNDMKSCRHVKYSVMIIRKSKTILYYVIRCFFVLTVSIEMKHECLNKKQIIFGCVIVP